MTPVKQSMLIPQPATISEIATAAGVGPATVDRVLNNRSHVRETTRQRVLQAKAALESGRRQIIRAKPWRLKAVLPSDAGPSTEYFAKCLQEFGTQGNATIECEFVRKLNPALLARKLIATTGQGVDAVLFQALEHPRVTAAVEVLDDHKIPSLAVLSGLATPKTIGTVGADNRIAGRTAGYLMGRLTRQKGTAAVVIGGELYRGHEDRVAGFKTAIRNDFRHIENVITLVGHDEREGTYQSVIDAIGTHSELIGIYNVGAANSSIANALKDTDTAEEIVFIGHHLTGTTKSALLEGTMDIVLHMNFRAIAEQAVNTMIAHLEGQSLTIDPIPIDVVTRENLIGVRFNDAREQTRKSSFHA